MAVEILVLAKDGTDRKAGTIVAIKECEDTETCVWGSAECPPTFHVIRIDGKKIADLPKEWLEYGGHKSRALIDKTKLDASVQASLDKEIRVKVDHSKFALAVSDQGKDWQPKETIPDEEDGGEIATG